MSILNLINLNCIVISYEENLTVDNALELTCSKLIEEGKVELSYLDAIKSKHVEIGPYYVLSPMIAMPHARPEDGVNEAALQVTIFKNGVDLESEDNGMVYLSVTLAAIDSNSHIQTIVSLSELFQNNDDIKKIISCDNALDVYKILSRY
jgi:ascorbate PTS system EIIA or EIIAB component